MKQFLFLAFVLLSSLSFSQDIRVHGLLAADDMGQKLGQMTIYSLPDSSLKKGTYIDSAYFSVVLNTQGNQEFYAKIRLTGYADTLISFSVTDSVVDLGMIVMSKSVELETFEFVYREPMYERTMDGIEVNVTGTTLETMDNLFEILKASPKLNSPDDQSIEIIGKGAPLILVDRQPILTNDELKAIPANMVEKVEIITNPSAKYRAQGRGSGVIEVYTKNFRLQGYNMNINFQAGMSTQLKPASRLGIGLSLKKKKFSMNVYAGGNYNSSNSYGFTNNTTTDSIARTNNSTTRSDNWNVWEHFSLKSAYQINDRQKIAAGIRGGGSIRNNTTSSETAYADQDELLTTKDQESTSSGAWLNNSAFLNYTLETDTNKSVFEVNLNYQLKVDESQATYNSIFENANTGYVSYYDRQNKTRNRPNVGEIRMSYEHIFDTTGWKLSGGGSYSIVFNGMRFDQLNLVNSEWMIDPIYSNSYDYTEQIGSVFTEVTKNWKKVSVRAGLTGEYTDLDGYSHSLSQQFMDSSYFKLFPSGSIMVKPAEKVSMTLRYSSGIRRPQFSNYDPFVRVQDSLSISYGNPYLRPAVNQNIGFDLDLFYKYGLSLDYSFSDNPSSNLEFIDTNFVQNSTPWNADNNNSMSVSLNLPLKTKWMSGWNSIWLTYTTTHFTPEFQRNDFSALSFGMWSFISFYLPKDFTITNRLHLMRWGNEMAIGNFRANWGMKLTKKMLNNNLSLFVEVQDIVPPKYKSNGYSSNYTSYSESRYQFTTFNLGLYFKFGRLKRETSIQESESGQSGRI